MPNPRLLAIALAGLLLVGPQFALAQSDADGGRLVRFPLTQFDDTLFAGVDVVTRVTFDEAGHVWYSTQAGVIEVDVDAKTRQFYTRMEGLPSSYSLSLAAMGAKVYVGTDLGIGIIDRLNGEVTGRTTANSPLPDGIVREVATDGDVLWVGTHFGGVVAWNTTTDEWEAKNTSTTAGFAKPVRRIVPTTDHVWVGTDGDGVWKYDRATGEWSVLLKVDGLPSNTVLSVLERHDGIWLGTDAGLVQWTEATGEFRVFTSADGMPDERVYDLDDVPTEDGGSDVFASTRKGVWQFHPETGGSATRAQEFGILGSFVVDQTWDETKGWVFATSRGVSLLRDLEWQYFSTGPSTGASMGPLNYRFTAVSACASEPFIWFGSDNGVTAYLPPRGDELGEWFNFGEWQRFPGGPVNWIDCEGNTTWMGTNSGVVGYNTETDRWTEMPVANSRNLVYGLDVDRGELWVPLFGDGLVMRNLTTGAQRAWNYESTPQPIPDQYLTDLHIHGNEVWLGASIGVIRMDRVSGSFLGTYTIADGLPGTGVVFRILPDSGSVWAGMKHGGLAKLDVASGRVTKVWNATETPGFPDSEVLSLHREGGRLWAGTKAGLVRVDVTTGAFKTFNQSNSDLVQDFVYGMKAQDGILYMATGSGIARLDIASERFLPMRDSALAQHGGTDGGAWGATINARIDSPRDGTGVTGLVDVRGTAAVFGGRVDRVEVRIGEGEWVEATGASAWNLTWDSGTAPANTPITLAARAWSGENASRVHEILVTPVALPETPLTLEHKPLTEATALRSLLVGAKATGDEPLKVTLYYKTPGRDVYTRMEMARQGAIFTARIPAAEVREGTLTYYLDARSGLLSETSPEDALTPHRVPIGPPPTVAVDVQGPTGVVAEAGKSVTLALNVTNAGTQATTVEVAASGLRASWVDVSTEPLSLEPGETRSVQVTLSVPAAAFHDNTTLKFEVRDLSGVAESARAEVPVTVLAAPDTVDPQENERTERRTPAPVALLLVAALGAALVARRRRE